MLVRQKALHREWELSFSPYGEAYVAYKDGANSHKASVMKYIDGMSNVNDITNDNITNVYPIPANSNLNIEVKEATSIKIVTLSGTTVTTQKLDAGRNNIDVSYLAPGLYFLHPDKGVGLKFIKE